MRRSSGDGNKNNNNNKRKTISRGGFLQERQAALAFDAEARKDGRAESYLNLPKEIASDDQITAWKEASARCNSYFNSNSKYRGVHKDGGRFVARVNMQKVVLGEGNRASLGSFKSEIAAALQWDRTCRKHGVPEEKLNFPRNTKLGEVRLFDDECYSCLEENPTNPLATPCNHVFCTDCVTTKLCWSEPTTEPKCPCCSSLIPSKDTLRPITLIPREKATIRVKKEQPSENKDPATTEGSRRYNTRGTGGDHRTKDYSTQPRYPIGTEFSRRFLEGTFKGIVTAYDGKRYTVRFEDGDVMKMSEDDFDYNDVDLYYDDEEEEAHTRNISNPKYPTGTKFVKDFGKDLGKFEGQITSFNGWHYRVFYPQDKDEEELSEHDFDTIEILSMPKSAGEDDDDNTKPSTDLQRQNEASAR